MSALRDIVLFEVYDEDLKAQITTYLKLHDIDCLLPRDLNPDRSLTFAIHKDGLVRSVHIATTT